MKNFLFTVSCILSLSSTNALERLTEADIDKIDDMARKVMNSDEVARFIDVEGICAGNEKFAQAFAEIREIAADNWHAIDNYTTIDIRTKSVEFFGNDTNPREYIGRYRNGHVVRYRGMIAYAINMPVEVNVSFNESENSMTLWAHLSNNLWNILLRKR